MIDDFLKIINSNQTKIFLEKAISTLYHKDYPFCTYLGINYTDEKLLNVKLYITAFKKIDFELTKSFFPYSKTTHETYLKYNESKSYDPNNMGVAFIQKQNTDGSLIYTFGFRSENACNPPLSTFNLIHEEKVVNDYIAIEGSSGKIYPKYYYIFQNRTNINHLISEFDLPINSENVDLIEYSKFERKEKILLATKNSLITDEYLLSKSPQRFLLLHNFLKENLNLIPVSPGKYLNSNVKSIHYFDPGEPVYFRNSFALVTLLEKLKTGAINY